MNRPNSPPTTAVPVEAYSRPHAPPNALRLDGNEGNVPPARLLADLANQDIGLLRNYPSTSALERDIATRLDVEPKRVVVTAGADDGIDRVCRAFLGPGRQVILPVPTFEMFYRFAATAGGSVATIPWIDNYPVEEIVSTLGPTTTLVAIVSPNNPTGRVVTANTLKRVAAAAASAIVLLDHAYVEYADEDLSDVAMRFSNVVVLRTFSKAWGLAGCRVGYAVASPEVANILRNAGSPYPVSGLSLAVATNAFTAGETAVAEHVRGVKVMRSRLTEQLGDLGVPVDPSQGNFVFARFGARTRFVNSTLASRGVVVRYFPHRPELATGLRITVPDNERDFARLMEALRHVLLPDALLFDMDGVLADVEESYRRCTLETARSFGVSLTRADVEDAVLAGDANNDWVLTQRLLATRGVDATLDEVTERYQEIYLGTSGRRGLRHNEKLLTRRDVLEGLARRMPLAVVTGRPRAEAAWFLERADIADLFSTVVCLEDGPLKPDPAPVTLAMRKLGASRVLMVGDTPDDIVAARKAGALALGIVAPGNDPTATTTALERAGAGWVLDDLAEIGDLIQ